MDVENLIFSLSGIRGIVENDLNFNIIKKVTIAYGLWLDSKNTQVILGRDTRPSGEIIEKAAIEGLISVGLRVVNLGVCPTPIIIYTKKKLEIPGGIIITGSHNPKDWNGLKLLSTKRFLNNNEINEILFKINKIDLNHYHLKKINRNRYIKNMNPVKDYIKYLYKYIDYKGIKYQNNLSVIIDTGAGTGKIATPQILSKMGCQVKLINNDLLVNNIFPREIEPIEKNLKDLRMEVWQGNHDIGFAFNADANRLAIVGENGVCYPEDIGLALITEYYLKNYYKSGREVIFVTNLASSLRFEVIAERYNAQVIRTQIGEIYLIEKMNELKKEKSNNVFLFGGEGSCGGVIIPEFNNTRDGIFAASKIVEILVKTGKRVSELVSSLPKYYSYREKINVKKKNINKIIRLLKKELTEEGEELEQFNLDLRFGKDKEWFILIHPSNTEPIIRVISEAKRKSLARVYCEATAALVKQVISTL
ncbi:MAG: hypothetical protein ACFFHD_06995 [Promethearchaeota archaeon]